MTLLALGLSAACVPIEDDENDLEELLECGDPYGMTPDELLTVCAYIRGTLYGMQATCIEGFEDPSYFGTWDPDDTPEACEAYGPFCWKCGQIYGHKPKGTEVYTYEVIQCLDDLVRSSDTCDVGYVASAEAGPCWLISTGGQL